MVVSCACCVVGSLSLAVAGFLSPRVSSASVCPCVVVVGRATRRGAGSQLPLESARRDVAAVVLVWPVCLVLTSRCCDVFAVTT